MKNPARFEKVSADLLELLDKQVEVIVGRTFSELSEEEQAAYQDRKRRIRELQVALRDLT